MSYAEVQFQEVKLGIGVEMYRVEVSNTFVASEDLDTEVDIHSTWETNRQNIKISAKRV
jgi:hypothetical protein